MLISKLSPKLRHYCEKESSWLGRSLLRSKVSEDDKVYFIKFLQKNLTLNKFETIDNLVEFTDKLVEDERAKSIYTNIREYIE